MQEQFSNAGAKDGVADMETFILWVWIMFGDLDQTEFIYYLREMLSTKDFGEMLAEKQELEANYNRLLARASEGAVAAGSSPAVSRAAPGDDSAALRSLLENERLRREKAEDALAEARQQVVAEKQGRHSLELVIEQVNWWKPTKINGFRR